MNLTCPHCMNTTGATKMTTQRTHPTAPHTCPNSPATPSGSPSAGSVYDPSKEWNHIEQLDQAYGKVVSEKWTCNRCGSEMKRQPKFPCGTCAINDTHLSSPSSPSAGDEQVFRWQPIAELDVEKVGKHKRVVIPDGNAWNWADAEFAKGNCTHFMLITPPKPTPTLAELEKAVVETSLAKYEAERNVYLGDSADLAWKRSVQSLKGAVNGKA